MSNNFDRFNTPYYESAFPDIQEESPYARCYLTGLPLFEGEDAILLPNGQYLKDDKEVLIAYINGVRVTVGEEN